MAEYKINKVYTFKDNNGETGVDLKWDNDGFQRIWPNVLIENKLVPEDFDPMPMTVDMVRKKAKNPKYFDVISLAILHYGHADAIKEFNPSDDIFGEDPALPGGNTPPQKTDDVGKGRAIERNAQRTTTEDIHFQVAIKEIGIALCAGKITDIYKTSATKIAKVYTDWVMEQLGVE